MGDECAVYDFNRGSTEAGEWTLCSRFDVYIKMMGIAKTP